MTGRAQVFIVGLLLIVSILVRQPLLFVLCLALMLAAGATWLWERHCLDRVEYRRRFSQTRAFFGEEVELTIEVVNRKILPLAWLIIEDEVPRTLSPTTGAVTPSHKPGRRLLTNLFSLRWYERVRRYYRLQCSERGEFAFGPAQLRSGDLFGFTSRDLVVPTEDLLLVYPRVVPLTSVGLPASDPFGDRSTRQWLFDDPTRLIGVRDYRPGDSLRRIHWAATARTQQLQVKLYEPTITYRLVIMLNLNTAGDSWWWPGYLPEILELSIMTAASVASWATEHDYQVGLAANGTTRLSTQPVWIAPSRDPEHLTRILEALALVTPVATLPLAELLRLRAATLPYGATIVVISARAHDDAIAELIGLQRRGHSVALLLTGDPLPTSQSLPIRVLSIGGAPSWRERTSLAL